MKSASVCNTCVYVHEIRVRDSVVWFFDTLPFVELQQVLEQIDTTSLWIVNEVSSCPRVACVDEEKLSSGAPDRIISTVVKRASQS